MSSKKPAKCEKIILNVAPILAAEKKKLKYLTKKQRESLNKAIKKEIKILQSHFRNKNYGWPIDVDLTIDQVILNTLKIDLSCVICYTILKGLGDGFYITHKKGRSYYTRTINK